MREARRPGAGKRRSRWPRYAYAVVGTLGILGAALVAMRSALAGLAGRGLSSRPYRGPVSDHFDGRRFHAVPPTPRTSFFDILRWQRARPADDWHDEAADPEGARPASRVDGPALRVTFINHATLLIQHRGLNVLTDPVYASHAGPLGRFGPRRYTPPGIAFDALPTIDAILVSHNHYDHLDSGTLKRLARRFPAARVFTGLGNGPQLRHAGFGDVHELDWWQAAPLAAGISIRAVPARHWSERVPWNVDATLVAGFVMASPDGSIYFAGDTAAGEHFAQIAARSGPMRLAALPIGAYQPRWFMQRSHMSPAEAVAAARILGARQALAMHFGTFRLSDEGQHAPATELEAALRRVRRTPGRPGLPERAERAERFVALRPGGRLDVPPLAPRDAH